MVSLNNPFDLWLAINLMRNTPYEKALANELKSHLFFKPKASESELKILAEIQNLYNIDLKHLSEVTTWHAFDRVYTSKVFAKGPFFSLPEYYTRASCQPVMHNISVPTLVIHSKDDPIVPLECVPIDKCQANPHLITAIVPHGGHVCYFEGAKGDSRWYPRVCAEYFKRIIS